MAIMLKPKSHHGKLNRKKEEIRHSLHVFGVFFDFHSMSYTTHDILPSCHEIFNEN